MIIMIINRLFLLYDPDHVAIGGQFFTGGHVTLDRGWAWHVCNYGSIALAGDKYKKLSPHLGSDDYELGIDM